MNDKCQELSSSESESESPLPVPPSCFASHVPLVYVEVVPLDLKNNTNNYAISSRDDSLRTFTTESPELNEWISAVSRWRDDHHQERPQCSFLEASVKLFLWKLTLESSLTMRKTHLCIHFKDECVDKKEKGIRGRQRSSSCLRREHLVVMDENHHHHQQSPHKVVDNVELEHFSVIFLPQLNPTLPSTWPCICHGYAHVHNQHRQQQRLLGDHDSCLKRVSVTAGTMIRILPSVCMTLLTYHQSPGSSALSSSIGMSLSSIETHQRDSWKEQLTGEACSSPLHNHQHHLIDDKEDEEEVLHNHNPETVRQLLLRIKLMLSQPIRIATTAHALEHHARQGHRKRAMSRAIQQFYNSDNSNNDKGTKSLLPVVGSTSRAAARLLLVHSPNAGSGKTLLIQACFRKVMSQCNPHGHEDNGRIHIIRVGPLLAKYGVVYIDTALETILHQIVLSAAMHGQESICIILDHFDALFPGGGTSNNRSDAAAPALHAMTAHLKSLVQHLYQRQEFPFPKLNPLYNLELDTGTNTTPKTRLHKSNAVAGGCVLSIRLCLVAIVTCPDGGDSNNLSGNSGSTMHTTAILDAFGSNTRCIDRFRLPALTAHTRWRAFDRALAQLQDPAVIQSSTLREKLPFLAAAAVWARGAAFGRVAHQVQTQLVASNQMHTDMQDRANAKRAAVATVEIFSKALATVRQMTTATTRTSSSPTGSNVEFMAIEDNPEQQPDDALFASNVGGNAQAKRALIEALSLNPRRRQLLSALGLSPPTGILLYGAPGTGKVRILWLRIRSFIE
jgi:hypothetical protein